MMYNKYLLSTGLRCREIRRIVLRRGLVDLWRRLRRAHFRLAGTFQLIGRQGIAHPRSTVLEGGRVEEQSFLRHHLELRGGGVAVGVDLVRRIRWDNNALGARLADFLEEQIGVEIGELVREYRKFIRRCFGTHLEDVRCA